MTTTTYYAWVSVSENGTNTETRSIHRMVQGENVLQLERFDEKAGWVDNPGLLAAIGIGGDSHYHQITRSEAVEFLSRRVSREMLAQV
jgi:hypothetical protein